jgi:hypothetical protein
MVLKNKIKYKVKKENVDLWDRKSTFIRPSRIIYCLAIKIKI